MDVQYVRKAIEALIEGTIAEAPRREAKEKDSGISLRDDPKPHLLSPPRWEEDKPILEFGETTYLTSRRMWPVYKAAVQLVRELGANESILYKLFHFLPGVAALVEKDGCFLVGVRAENLAGTHTGKVSVPAGLMEIGENVPQAILRELKEETSLTGEIGKIAVGNNPDAPNLTFLCHIQNPQGEVKETYEAKGRRFVWVNKRLIISLAVDAGILELRDNRASQIVHAFRQHEIEVGYVELAPDIAEAIRSFYAGW